MSPLPSMLRGHRGRVLTAAVAGLVIAGVLIGLGIAWVGTTALEAAGLDTSQTTPPPTTPDPDPSADPGPSEPATPDETSAPPSTRPPPNKPTLTLSPSQVGTYEEIAVSGKFPGLAAGTALQIERRLDGGPWELFPVSLSSGEAGTFSTIVETGQTGENDFRVSVPGSLLTTPSVSVRVG